MARRTLLALTLVLPFLAFSVQPPAAAVTTCLPDTPLAPVHAATAASPMGLRTTPDTTLPQLERLPDGTEKASEFAVIGSIAYVVGAFSGVLDRNGIRHARAGAFAVNLDTGALLPWAPRLTGGGTQGVTIHPDCTGTSLYVGGEFKAVNNVPRQYAARVAAYGAADTASAVLPWNPRPNKPVEWITALGAGRAHLVLAGKMTTVAGQPRTGLASVHRDTGTPDEWLRVTLDQADPAGPLMVHRIEGSPAGPYAGQWAVAVGNFGRASHWPNPPTTHRRIITISTNEPRAYVSSWNAEPHVRSEPSGGNTDCSNMFGNPERDVRWARDGLTWYTASTGAPRVRPTICDTVSAWDGRTMGGTRAPIWQQFTGGDSVSGLAVGPTSLFTFGHMRWLNNPPTPGLVVTPCNDDVPPYKLTSGWAGYDCAGPTAVVRQGMGEINKNGTVTPYRWVRSREAAMNVVAAVVPQGLLVASDGTSVQGITRRGLFLIRYA